MSSAADAGLFDIYRYTDSNFGERQADLDTAELTIAFQHLCDNPKLGRSRDELRKGLRSLVKNQHLVFYRVKTDRIRIVRIIAMTQDLKAIFK